MGPKQWVPIIAIVPLIEIFSKPHNIPSSGFGMIFILLFLNKPPNISAGLGLRPSASVHTINLNVDISKGMIDLICFLACRAITRTEQSLLLRLV